LEKFFDRVNHDILMSRVAREVKDKRVLKLIRRYLEAGVMRDGLTQQRTEGTPQGGPLTPLTQKITSVSRRRNTSGSRRRVIDRRRGWYRYGVADGNGVVTDQNLFDEKSNDTP